MYLIRLQIEQSIFWNIEKKDMSSTKKQKIDVEQKYKYKTYIHIE